MQAHTNAVHHAAQTNAPVAPSQPLPLDASLLRLVAGGAGTPKGGW